MLMPAVNVDNLSKIYKFYDKPSHRLWEAIFRRPMHTSFCALENISFKVPKGSTLGIIGVNGAGKSTLLKLLSGTLSPSSGKIETRGRVAALLELGAGFHLEFTGRGNIYLNASLLGMSQEEIKGKEEEIIAFAELEEFIDRPIKTYSSGMAVRLGFSIATSIDPEILVVDEALSVGDQRFQDKCIKRMQNFIHKGKTIIVCSHSMYLINTLCNRCIWLEQGRIKQYGKTDEIVSAYLADQERNVASSKANSSLPEPETAEVVVDKINIQDASGQTLLDVSQFSDVKVSIHTRNIINNFRGHIAVVLEDQSENQLFAAFSKNTLDNSINFSSNSLFSLLLPRICLQKGAFFVRAVITDEHGMRIIHQKRRGPYTIISTNPEYGLLWMEHHWIMENTENQTKVSV